MTALGIFVRLETKSGNPHGYDGSMRVKAANNIRKIFAHVGSMATGQVSGGWLLFMGVHFV